jgi:diaminopimelate epimerase
MGKVTFDSTLIPVTGPSREVIDEELLAAGQVLRFCAASVGNPHCVILRDATSAEEARTLGPTIETDKRFPNRTNVQFVEVLDRSAIRIEIWERGAGYTLASGSSACAAAAVARKLDLCDPDVTVHMPGGRLRVALSDDFSATMTGPVAKVAEGTIGGETFSEPPV